MLTSGLAAALLASTGCVSSAQDTRAPTVSTGAPTSTTTCQGVTVARMLTFTGDEAGDRVGLDLDVADLDGNGCAELVVAAPWQQWPYQSGVHGGVYLLEQPQADGPLQDEARTSWPGGSGYDSWGEPMVALSELGLVAITGYGDGPDRYVHLFDGSAVGAIGQDQTVAQLFTPPPTHEYGIPSALTGCVGPSGAAAFCASGRQSGATVDDWAGQTLLYEGALLTGDVHVDSYTSRMFGEYGDHFRFAYQVGDLDGDGRADLVLGSETNQVAVVTEPVPGDSAIRDVAAAVIAGGPSGFGLDVTSGDLDGDGTLDLIVGAWHSDQVYGFRGPPFAADASSADWVVTDTSGLREFGHSVVVADLASDGTTELAVGAPDDTYRGAVLLFAEPPVGALDDTDAAATLRSGLQEADDFGIAMDVGDIDGDETIDLAVGAPGADLAGEDSGAVYLFYGASGAI